VVGVDVAEAKSTAAVLGRYPGQADVNDLAVLAGPGVPARVPTPLAFELAPLNVGNPWIVGVQGLGSAPACRARLRNLASMAIALELGNKLIGGTGVVLQRECIDSVSVHEQLSFSPYVAPGSEISIGRRDTPFFLFQQVKKINDIVQLRNLPDSCRHAQ
jgi:hypothetical protein